MVNNKSLEFRDLTVEIPNTDQNVEDQPYERVLSCVSGHFTSGKLGAIVGGSNSGKTTLARLLSGFTLENERTLGVILSNDEPRYEKLWIRQCTYLDEDRYKFESENLSTYIKIVAGAENTDENRKIFEEKLLEILKFMGYNEEILTTEAKHLKIVDMKKITIAIELARLSVVKSVLHNSTTDENSIGFVVKADVMLNYEFSPKILILDEPTRGLESEEAIGLLKIIKNIVYECEKTVIITERNLVENTFKLYDEVLILNKGISLYCGETEKLNDFYTEYKLEKEEITPNSFFIEKFLETGPDMYDNDVEVANARELIKNITEEKKLECEKRTIGMNFKYNNDAIEISYPSDKNQIFNLLRRQVLIDLKPKNLKSKMLLVLSGQILIALIVGFLAVVSVIPILSEKGQSLKEIKNLSFWMPSKRLKELFNKNKFYGVEIIMNNYLHYFIIFDILTSHSFFENYELMNLEIDRGYYSAFACLSAGMIYDMSYALIKAIITILIQLIVSFGTPISFFCMFITCVAYITLNLTNTLISCLTNTPKAKKIVRGVLATLFYISSNNRLLYWMITAIKETKFKGIEKMKWLLSMVPNHHLLFWSGIRVYNQLEKLNDKALIELYYNTRFGPNVDPAKTSINQIFKTLLDFLPGKGWVEFGITFITLLLLFMFAKILITRKFALIRRINISPN